MGYLDNSTIVVDAVLTKEGRQLLAQGQGLNIAYFTLSDTGVDYTLWNPDHPSGSAYYGEAIENLPSLEALPNGAYFQRNKLLTLNRNTTNIPVLVLNGQTTTISHTFSTNDPFSVIPTLSGGNVDQSGYILIVPQSGIINVGGSGVSTGGTISNALANQFLNESDVATAQMYQITSTGVANTTSFVLNPSLNLANNTTVACTVISIATGVYRTFNVQVNSNIGSAP
tara:strand:+ start:285 stop:965 length:681 start_codon:yes stop_codon:yes gene_type:complete